MGAIWNTEERPNRKTFQSIDLKNFVILYKIQIQRCKCEDLALINSLKTLFFHACPKHTQYSHSLTHIQLIQSQTHTHTHSPAHKGVSSVSMLAQVHVGCGSASIVALFQSPLCLSFRVLGCWQRPTWTLCSQWSPLCEVPFLFCFPIPVVIKPPTVPHQLQNWAANEGAHKDKWIQASKTLTGLMASDWARPQKG